MTLFVFVTLPFWHFCWCRGFCHRTESDLFLFLLLLSIGRDGQLHTSIYDKRDDFNFHITNFPFLSSNIPTSPAYGVFISQLIRYARACSSYGCFILRATRLSNKLLEQGNVKERLKSSLRKFYGRYGDLIKQYHFPLTNVKWHTVTRPYTMTTPYWSASPAWLAATAMNVRDPTKGIYGGLKCGSFDSWLAFNM